ncbi:peptide-N-glycosidase F-related protein [Flavobacterium sp. J27]|uniref:peptide-N-glycosidase F-related protein n=1 Tax=Flavobacterium sp. J27 TaxID=2060419 RepID=UPI001030680B|nr:peptide-N-glycosidase F-related protein [Flavobacterium sp. J27]
MKKKYFFLLIFLGIYSSLQAQVTIPIYNDVLFYDGYAGLVNDVTPLPSGVIRLRNDLFTKKLTPNVISQIGNTLTLDISISASCDNYDRIGNINLALVPKNATSYVPESVARIELGRIITPFMNKNVPPNIVPYTFSVDNVTKILKDSSLNSQYDFWIEFELFGVPYAANTQIAGCSGRNDVFFGTLNFITNVDTATTNDTFLLPLNFKNYLNNYQVGASDAIGTTVRTINFTLSSAVENATFYFITSNHGSNTGGEEYNRRLHQISFDISIPSLTYTPGESTCEPYRVYNTQSNGIYGASPRTPAQWQSFSNWCPGAKIPIRTLSVGNLSAGNHFFKIAVPTAQFVNQEGYFPISVYLQGESTLLSTEDFNITTIDIYPNPTTNFINVKSSIVVTSVELLDLEGRVLTSQIVNGYDCKYDLSTMAKGIYFLKVNADQNSQIEKIIKN